MAHVAREPERITSNEVKAMMDRGEPLVIVDARTPESYSTSPVMIMGAIRISPDEIEERFVEIPLDKKTVIYCTSPHEATSLRVAKQLIDKGYTDVHPLLGGFEEWLRKGLPIESK